MRAVSAGRSETGLVRKHNEDAILVGDGTGIWVVADGLGGHSAGDFASQMVVERLGQLRRSADLASFVEQVEDTIAQINGTLRATAVERSVDLIGTTAVVLILGEHHMACGWVGDSRCYCFDGDHLQQITRDHSQGAEAGPGPINLMDTLPPPGGGALTRAVGAEDTVFLDWVVAEKRSGVQFLLCSDGINKEIVDAELESAFRRDLQPQALVDAFFELALSRRGRDNLSAVVVRLQV